jgi:hypothetical protein
MSEEAAATLERAVGLWRKAQVVHEGPTRLGFPEPLEAVLEIAGGHPECHDGLVNLLSSDCQVVVAYALLTLQAMGSEVLKNLPQHLLERREKVTIDSGSFRNSMDLGGLARQIQKRARRPPQQADDVVRPT